VRHVIVTLPLALTLTCCGSSTRPARLPALPAQIAAPCPPLAPIGDVTIAALVLADAEAAFAYARCQAKHRAAVDAYEAARGQK
jgi:hypothetical protein